MNSLRYTENHNTFLGLPIPPKADGVMAWHGIAKEEMSASLKVEVSRDEVVRVSYPRHMSNINKTMCETCW